MKTLSRAVAIIIFVLFGRLASAGAQTLTTLYTFDGSINTNGCNPESDLLQGSDGEFYGTTAACSYGTIFKISSAGTLTTLYDFTQGADGSYPGVLVQGQDGDFYGMTAGVPDGGHGTVFKMSSAGTLTTLYTFTGGADGGSPAGALVPGTDGNFYGTTFLGGTSTNCFSYGCGTVFKISPAGTLTTLYTFTGGADGGVPGGLVLGSDSNFYGFAIEGGNSNDCPPNGSGTVFKMTPGGALTTLYAFTGGADGNNPDWLLQGNDGNFYGTTEQGGTSQYGNVFKLTRTGTLTSLYSFTDGADGRHPNEIVQGSDSNFYGTTVGNQTAGDWGTVFKISSSGTLTTLYNFTGGADGASPQAGLVLGSDRNFYGTTGGDGSDSGGTVFKLDAGLGVISTNCTFSLGSTNSAVGGSGGSNNVGVTASPGCAWMAASESEFITITSGSGGTGNGIVSYTTSTNESVSMRTGTMVIADQSFTVEQASIVTSILSDVKQSCKTKKDVTTCKLSTLLTMLNNGKAEVPSVPLRFFSSSNTAYNAGTATLLGEVTTKPIKAGKSLKLTLKKTLTESLAGEFILAVDASNNVVASVQVP